MDTIICKCCDKPLMLSRKTKYESCVRCGYNYMTNKKMDIIQRKLWWMAKIPWYIYIPLSGFLGYLLGMLGTKLLIITHVIHAIKK